MDLLFLEALGRGRDGREVRELERLCTGRRWDRRGAERGRVKREENFSC